MTIAAEDLQGSRLHMETIQAVAGTFRLRAAVVAARILLGLLLLVTAGMKAQVFVERSSPAFAIFGSLRLQVAAITCSAVLGVWLLSGKGIGAGWAAAVAYFSLLAGASFAMGVQEWPTCGCFGKLPVNPWVAFGIDLAALTMLFALRPAGGWWRIGRRPFPGRAVPPLGVGLAFTSILLGASAALAGFGSPTAAFWFLRGEPVAAVHEDSVITGNPWEWRLIPVTLVNRGPVPVTIYGGTSRCGLHATGDLPLTIAPGETRSPKVRVFFGGGSGLMYPDGVFYTDAIGQPEVGFWLALRIVEKIQ
jgi:hypothetical protein